MGRLCRFFFLGVLAMAMVYSIRPGFTQTTRQMVERSGGTVEVFIEGQGPRVVMIPSPGRGAEDFADLAGRVSAAGYRVVGPQPRGIGGSRGTLEGITLREIAADVASVIETLQGQPAFVVGHAFGNRGPACWPAIGRNWSGRSSSWPRGGKRPWSQSSGIR